jgi:flavin-dependent dehydrogenase
MTHPDRIDHYDAVIVGARAAGAATALLLARAGLDVLVVDRDHYGDDTVSTHGLMRGGVVQLHRWGVLDDVIAAGTPPVRRTIYHVGAERIAIDIKDAYGVDALYAPRRTVLDPILADAASAAGAHVRFGVTATGPLRDQAGRVAGITGHDARGRPVRATATITIGADGRNSRLARWAGARLQRTGTSAAAFAYAYWSGVDAEGYEFFFRPRRVAGIIPTNDDQVCVFVGTTPEDFRRQLLRDPMGGYLDLLRAAAPEAAMRVRDGTRRSTLHRFPGRPGHIRQAWGRGWALVGDAGYYKDPISAHGLTDALRDADLLARAVIEGLDGDMDAALDRYERTRNDVSHAVFSITEDLAAFDWDAARGGRLLRELSVAVADELEVLALLDRDDALVGGP